MSAPKLILASASPRRLALLEQIGIRPDEIAPADIDESVAAKELPRQHALRIAISKAHTVQQKLGHESGSVILSADTVVACGRRILPKAEDGETVKRCLKLLSGRRHTVLTAVAVIATDGQLRSRICETKVAFRKLGDAEIEDYCQRKEGLGKAGGYAIQGRAAVFVRFLAGSYSNVVGLPLMETFHLLNACGVR